MKQFFVTSLLIGIIGTLVIALFSGLKPKDDPKSTLSDPLPQGYSTLFAGSGSCAFCHTNLSGQSGQSYTIVNDWRSTIMANASKDPYWKAKVEHETTIFPGLKDAIEDKCTRCHAAAGNYEKHFTLESNYSMQNLSVDKFGKDGVTCTVCHQINANSMNHYSGDFELNHDKIIYGPFDQMQSQPMFNMTGYQTQFASHIRQSALCGNCHTLITGSVNENGNPTGNSFYEQTIFQEWKNSDYITEGTSCQNCHIPEVNDPVIISSLPTTLNNSHSPFGLHQFAGANIQMLQLMKDNSSGLGLTAEDSQMQESIDRTTAMLESAIHVELTVDTLINDSITLCFQIENLAGHKFPSGFPSRRVFIEAEFTDGNDTLLVSGKTDADGNIQGEDFPFEPHHQIIRSSDEVQIYESVMADYLGNFTRVLLMADSYLKDNRIPPAGFTSGHISYDSCSVSGNALTDPDFNVEGTNEGSGTDKVYYRFQVSSMLLDASLKVYYQSVNTSWVDEMEQNGGSVASNFSGYFDQLNDKKILVAELDTTIIFGRIPETSTLNNFIVYPNPARPGTSIHIKSERMFEKILLFSAEGKELLKLVPENVEEAISLPADLDAGIYYCVVWLDGQKAFKKLIVL